MQKESSDNTEPCVNEERGPADSTIAVLYCELELIMKRAARGARNSVPPDLRVCLTAFRGEPCADVQIRAIGP
jgi:hypothetical protein